MWEKVCAGTILIVGGMLTMIGITRRWRLFVNNLDAKFIFRLLGNTGATVFYVAMGLIFVVIGILIITGTLPF